MKKFDNLLTIEDNKFKEIINKLSTDLITKAIRYEVNYVVIVFSENHLESTKFFTNLRDARNYIEAIEFTPLDSYPELDSVSPNTTKTYLFRLKDLVKVYKKLHYAF